MSMWQPDGKAGVLGKLSRSDNQLDNLVPQVGTGKSSILAALLGELQPFVSGASTEAAADAGPAVHGRVAYCSQVPWVVAGSIRVRHGLDLPACDAKDIGQCTLAAHHRCLQAPQP